MAHQPARPLSVGAYSFASSGSIPQNLAAIRRGMKSASASGVRLLLLHECALTGYAPKEIPSPHDIDRPALRDALTTLRDDVRHHDLYLAIGTTTLERGAAFNTLLLLGPDGRTRLRYDKRALIGTDNDHYTKGRRDGIATVDGYRVGLRICFEFRFPELFRPLLMKNADLCLCAFHMVDAKDKPRSIARSHLCSRAAENGMYLLSANRIAKHQNCPVLLCDPTGVVQEEASLRQESLLKGEILPRVPHPLQDQIRTLAKRLCTDTGKSR